MNRTFSNYIMLRENTGGLPVRLYKPMKVPPEVEEIHKAFQRHGYKIYVAGGAVRDHLMNLTPKDFDLATGVPPETVQHILDESGIKRTDTVGQRFGVVVASFPKDSYEIATFRRDLEAKRQTKVEFSSIGEDAKRRDLTMNALYYDLDTDEIIDYVGGIDDIKNGIIKTVGSPSQRFGEDAIRVLRLIRFANRLRPTDMNDLDKETQRAIWDRVTNGLKGDDDTPVSAEAIREEFLKGIKASKSVPHYIKMLYNFGLLSKYIFPGLSITEKNIQDEMTVDAKHHGNYLLVIAYLLKNNETDKICRILNSLKYKNDEISKIAYLIKLLNLNQRDIHKKLAEDPNYLYMLKKHQHDIPKDDLKTWSNWHDLDSDTVHDFTLHTLKNRNEVPGSMELKGPDLGRHLVKHNTEEMMRKFGFSQLDMRTN